MKKKSLSFILVICMMFSFGISVYAVDTTIPYVSEDSVSVSVGGSTSVNFSYGTSATSVDPICSSLCADVSISGSTLYIKGVKDGTCFVTLRFNDGTTSTIRVDVGNVSSGSSNSDYDYEIKKGSYKNIYVDLDEYDATRATITYNSSYVSVNKTTFYSSGYLKVTGRSYGDCTVKVKYNTGDVETYYIDVVSYSGSYDDSDEEIYLDDIDDTATYYIDLDDYDADSARITYDDDYVEVNKTYFSSNGTLRITGIDEGESEIKVKYDSGDTIYLTVYCGEDYHYDSEREEEDFDVSLNGTVSYYIDLYDYDADRATISYSSSYVSVNKTSFSSDGTLKITAKKKGNSIVKVKYDSGDIVYLNIYCEGSGNDPYVSKEDISVKKGSSTTFYVYLEDCDKATLSVSDTSIATVSRSSVSSNTSVTVTGKKVGDTKIKVKFDDGSSVSIPVEVTSASTTQTTNVYAEVEDDVIEINNATVLKLETNNSYSTAYVTIDNPSALKLDVSNYSKYTKTYTISIGTNSSKEINLVGLDYGKYNVTVKFGSSTSAYTYDFWVEVVDNIQEECEGITNSGRQYRLNKGISIDKTVLDSGYISGYTDGTFGPNLNVTREEFGVMLSRILEGKDKVVDADYISDVTSTWSKDGIAELVSMGIVSPMSNYRPTDKITREEVVEMLYNALDLSDFGETCQLTDVYTSTLDRKISKCCNSGVISGYPDGTFGGKNYITRAEVVTMLNRVFYKNNTTTKLNSFSDIDNSHWAYGSIVKAANR